MRRRQVGISIPPPHRTAHRLPIVPRGARLPSNPWHRWSLLADQRSSVLDQIGTGIYPRLRLSPRSLKTGEERKRAGEEEVKEKRSNSGQQGPSRGIKSSSTACRPKCRRYNMPMTDGIIYARMFVCTYLRKAGAGMKKRRKTTNREGKWTAKALRRCKECSGSRGSQLQASTEPAVYINHSWHRTNSYQKTAFFLSIHPTPPYKPRPQKPPKQGRDETRPHSLDSGPVRRLMLSTS